VVCVRGVCTELVLLLFKFSGGRASPVVQNAPSTAELSVERLQSV
jgi:hypothetical protein